MEIMLKNNNHLKTKQEKQGRRYCCECDTCGTIFTFKEYEITRPRMINPEPKDCYVKCPNEDCNAFITMDKFKSSIDFIKWLNDDSLLIDGTGLKLNDEILVSNDKKDWYKRHFSHYRYDSFYAFNGGTTSFTARNHLDYSGWKYAKTPEK